MRTSVPTRSSRGRSDYGNYALNYASADLTIGQRALTVTADAKSRAYGDVDPALTYQVTTGLVNGDSLSGGLDPATTARMSAPTASSRARSRRPATTR